jgi:hypothetical protein
MTEINIKKILEMLESCWYESPRELDPEMKIIFLICVSLLKIPKSLWAESIPALLSEFDKIKQEYNLSQFDAEKLITAGICFACAFYAEYLNLLKNVEISDIEDSNEKKPIH